MEDYELNQRLEKDSQLMLISNLLREKEMSIAELQRALNMRRSTLIYYLGILQSRGVISRERIEKKRKGRPTLLKFNEEAWNKNKKELNEKEEKVYEIISNLPPTKEILKVIKDNPNIDMNDLLNHSQIRDYVRKFQVVNWLHQNKLIKEAFFITEKGEAFLI